MNFYVGDFIGNKEVPTPFMKNDNNHQGFFPIERGEVRDVEGWRGTAPEEIELAM